MNERVGSYKAVREVVAFYWRSYGGARALVRSPYLHAAIALTVLMLPAWYSREWWTNVLQILPNIVGFSIGGYAIWLGFGDEKFKALISYRAQDDETSPYMEVSATFCHFVVVQLTAIAVALIGAAFHFDGSQVPALNALAAVFGLQWHQMAPVLRVAGGFVGFLLFTYALTTALAAVFAIFELARWFDAYRTVSQKASGQQTPGKSSPPAAGGNSVSPAAAAQNSPSHAQAQQSAKSTSKGAAP